MPDWMRKEFDQELEKRKQLASPGFQAGLAGMLEDLKNWQGVQQWEMEKAIDQPIDEAKRANGQYVFPDPVAGREAIDQLMGFGVGDVGKPAMFAEVLRSKPDPKEIVKAYKLFRVEKDRPGELFPLFVKMMEGNDGLGPHGPSVPMGSWQDAEIGASAGTTATGIQQVKSKIGPLSFRPGWHAGDYPVALHIGEGKAPRFDVESGKIKKMPTHRRANEVWAEVDMANDKPWQEIANERAKRYKSSNPRTGAVKGEINPVTAAITDQIPEDGFYRYKTNPNMLGNWLIGGSMKVNRLLSDDEIRAINESLGVNDLPRRESFDWKKYGF